jgi:hypothetical protein
VPPLPRLAAVRDHLVVCGDDALAARVIEELTTTYGEEVTVVVRSREQAQGPRIARLPRVRIIERAELDGAAVATVHQTGLVRVLAVQPPGVGPVNWSPAPDLRLDAQDRLYVIATRAGLSGVLARSLAPG